MEEVMFRMTIVAMILGSLMLTSSAPAQSKYGLSCQNGTWNILKDSDIAALKLTDPVSAFTKAVESAQAGDPVPRTIKVIVTDCPVDGHAIRAIKLPPALLVSGEGRFAMVSVYGLYVTVAYIGNTEEVDLARGARRHVCIIKSAVVENLQRPAEEPNDPGILKCVMDAAIIADDKEQVEWLAKILGVEVPKKR
jgi:hypothetical protein